jgi:tetratricopeptide (TPR) repeat protein
MIDNYKNWEAMGQILAENNEESLSNYKKAVTLFEQEKYDESLAYLDKAIEITPANERLNDYRNAVVEMMEIRKSFDKIKKMKSEMIKERQRLIDIGIWKNPTSDLF